MSERIGILTATGCKCANNILEEINRRAEEYHNQEGTLREEGEDVWEAVDLNGA